MTSKKTNFSTFGELTESKLFNNVSAFRRYNKRDIKNLIFLYLLSLAVLKYEPQTKQSARKYARNTVKFSNFDNFRQNSTDLYLMIHAMYGRTNQKSFQNIKKGRENIGYFNTIAVERWLKFFQQNSSNFSYDARFLRDAERQLGIKNGDYKNIRRIVTSWNKSSDRNKKVAVTRLVYALQTKAPRSEILPSLKYLSQTEGWKDIKRKPSHTSNFLKSMALGTAIAGGVFAYTFSRSYKKERAKRKVAETFLTELNLNEVASAGSTGAGSIAAIPKPIGSNLVKRRVDDPKSPYYRAPGTFDFLKGKSKKS